MTNYTIRNYTNADAAPIGAFAKILELAYRYNRDYEPANIFCAVDEDGAVGAVGHLEPTDSFTFLASTDSPPDLIHKLNLTIEVDERRGCPPELEKQLLDRLIQRACEIQAEYPSKKLRLYCYFQADEVEAIDSHLAKGFIHYDTHHIMRRDLKEPMPEYALPEGIDVRNWKMDTVKERLLYQQAEREAGEGDPQNEAWTLNRLEWYRGGPDWVTFTAFEGEQPVGSVMTWGLSSIRSATENIFVLPAWRQKGIARYLVTYAMRQMEERGKTEVTLGVYGTNKRAIALYKSLGYKLIFLNLGYGLDL